MIILPNNKFFVIFFLPFILGAITVLGFAPYNLTIINFFTFSILLFLILEVKKRTQSKYRKKKSNRYFFYLGCAFGFGFFLLGNYWISISLTHDDMFKGLIPFALILIPLFLSLFFGLAILFVGAFAEKSINFIILFSLIFSIFEFLRGELSGWQDIGNILKIEDDVLYIKLNTSNIKKNMNLKVDTNYDFKYNGVQIRIEDIKNEIEYFKKDTSSHVKTLIDNRQIELSKLEDRIKFNMTSTRVFTRGEFSYTIKVIDVRSDSVAIAKLIKLTNPYVTMRAGDKVKLRID